MRRAAKVDANQACIVKALRKIGASVQMLHAVGQGCPDVLVGYRSRNFLLEIKDGRKVKSARKLTDEQIEWITAWRGNVRVVENLSEAISAITGTT